MGLARIDYNISHRTRLPTTAVSLSPHVLALHP